MPWLGLGATLAWNYLNHRRHRSTICGVTRRLLPWPTVAAGVPVGAAVLLRHLWRGYVRD